MQGIRSGAPVSMATVCSQRCYHCRVPTKSSPQGNRHNHCPCVMQCGPIRMNEPRRRIIIPVRCSSLKVHFLYSYQHSKRRPTTTKQTTFGPLLRFTFTYAFTFSSGSCQSADRTEPNSMAEPPPPDQIRPFAGPLCEQIVCVVALDTFAQTRST